MEAAARRAERDAQRHYRQLQRNAKQQARLEALQQAAFEVEMFENKLERLTSVHKETPEAWDWNLIYSTPPPLPPERSSTHEAAAAAALNAYNPGVLDKLFGQAKTKRLMLTHAVETAIAQDEREYQLAYEGYVRCHTEWGELRQLAQSILQGDTQAYTDALVDYNPFADIDELGAAIEFKPHSSQVVEVRLTAEGDQLIPEQIKSLTSTGKLSTKQMPTGQFYDTYLDFVCGVALRAGRELFAFLPVQTVLVNIQATVLSTGRQATILSVSMPRAVFSQLNFDRLDPSQAMENFTYRMEFKKTSGFSSVEPLGHEEAVGLKLLDNPSLHKSVPAEPLPVVNDFEQKLSSQAPKDACYWLSAGATASLLGLAQQEMKLSLPVCRRIAQAIEQYGYCIEPDPRFGAAAYEWNQLVGIFRPAEREPITPSPAYQGAGNLLRLCVLVAAADGLVDKNELSIFRQIIENQLHFTQTELKRLTALERSLVSNAEAGAKTLAKAAKAVPADKRMLVAQVLVKVAAVDHVIGKSEFRVLERVFKAFELPPQKLSELMLEVCPAPEEPTIQEAAPGPSGEAIQGPSEVTGFSLDMSKVIAITDETREVVGILSVVMQDEKEEFPPAAQSVPPLRPRISGATLKPSDDNPAHLTTFSGLDPAFQPVLERLLAKDTWPRTEFHALAGEFHLMPLSIHDVINEWADESLGDFLLEGEDPVVIRRELIQEQKN